MVPDIVYGGWSDEPFAEEEWYWWFTVEWVLPYAREN